MSDSLRPHGLYSPCNSPVQASHSLWLQWEPSISGSSSEGAAGPREEGVGLVAAQQLLARAGLQEAARPSPWVSSGMGTGYFPYDLPSLC